MPANKKPMLASDWVESKAKFPLIAQPKIDGVRALNMTGVLTGRSLKKHRNMHVTELFSRPEFSGLDGEIAADVETHPDLCRITSSALSTIGGEPEVTWWLFDYITEATVHMPYEARQIALARHVESLGSLAARLRIVPSVICHTLDDLLARDEEFLDAGYEGTITRDPMGMHKPGRSTVREGGLLRIKRFIEEEAIVLAVHEGAANENEAQTNELGRTFRSSHQDNMIANGMIGRMTCQLLSDIIDGGRLLFTKGQIITVGPGCMPVEQRRFYFENQRELIGQVIKFKFFPKGIKDKPRFPTFQCIRSAEDMSEAA